jgi:hypothetical protein
VHGEDKAGKLEIALLTLAPLIKRISPSIVATTSKASCAIPFEQECARSPRGEVIV